MNHGRLLRLHCGKKQRDGRDRRLGNQPGKPQAGG